MFEMIMRRKRTPLRVAAAQNLHRIVDDAAAFERMDDEDHAENAWLDVAVAALARAELVKR